MDELDNLIAELDQFGEELERVTEVTLTDLANELPNQLKAKIFAEKQDRTGTLRNSICTIYTRKSDWQQFCRACRKQPGTYKRFLPRKSKSAICANVK